MRNRKKWPARDSSSYINYTILPLLRDLLASSFTMNDLFAFRIVAAAAVFFLLHGFTMVRKWGKLGKGSRYPIFCIVQKKNDWAISTLIFQRQQPVRLSVCGQQKIRRERANEHFVDCFPTKVNLSEECSTREPISISLWLWKRSRMESDFLIASNTVLSTAVFTSEMD